jgi:hypothetical protein
MQEEFFQQIVAEVEKDCLFLKKIFSKASNLIRDEGISNYPVFVGYKEGEPNIGIPLVYNQTVNTIWSYQASTLEELVAKSVVSLDKVGDFKAVFKSPDTHFCLLILQEDRAYFWFVPTQEDKTLWN